MSAPDDSSPAHRLRALAAPYDIRRPGRPIAPVVFASPHSGDLYPPEFLAASRLAPLALRRSEDAFIDELFAPAPAHGAPLLRATFPRVMVDPNREPYELDPTMFEDALPAYVNTRSPRVAAGLGTVARVVASGEEIYRAPLRFAEAERRLETYYRPYHRALAQLIAETREAFGVCLLVDCHSMPSVGGPMDADPGHKRVDIVLGDCHGTSCAPAITDLAEEAVQAAGLRAVRNDPYAGGYTTRHYGRPAEGVHVLQIEINRALYMDEIAIARLPGFAPLARRMAGVVEAICRQARAAVSP